MWLLEGVLSSAAGISLVSGSKGSRFFFGQVDSALDSNPGPGFFFWWVKPLDVGVDLCPLVGSCSYYKSVSWDQVLFIEILIYIFIKKTV